MNYKTGKVLTCPSCRNDFWLTSIEISFYACEGVSLPEECRSCRRLNEKENARKEFAFTPHIANFK